MKKKFIGLASFAIALSALAGGMATLKTSAETLNGEGWGLRDDGYYYEVDAPVMDLFDYYTAAVDDTYRAKTWYIVDYTGAMESGNFTLGSNTDSTGSYPVLSAKNNTIGTSQALLATYSLGGIWYPITSDLAGGGALSESARHMDFTFMVDFTNLDSGYIAYRNHATKISIDIANNQVIVEEKGATNQLDWSWSNMHTKFLPFDGLNDLTGWQQVTVLIEERVSESTAEMTRDNNKGAKVTVTIGDKSVSDTIEKMGYYVGLYAIENHTGTDLKLASTKSLVEFEENGGSEVANRTVNSGSALGELPTLTKAAWVFGGWYSSADFAEGTQLTSEMVVNGNMMAYAKWIAPESPNADGWVFNEEDGYFYEKNPFVMDLFDFTFNNEDAGLVADWYVMDFTGSPEVNNFTVSNRAKVSGGSAVLGTNQAMIVQYNDTIDNTFWQQMTGGNTNDNIRHMDFSVMIDFTDLTSGYIKYRYDSIMITIEFSSENIIVENRAASLAYDYKTWSNTHCEFISVPNLSSLTGVHKVTFLIEDRVLSSISEITRDNNKGAKVSVILDDNMAVSSIVQKVGYYGGFFSIENNCSQELKMYSTKATVNYVENGGTDIADETVAYGGTVTLNTEITKEGMTFDGWYTSEDFAEGTKVEGFDSLIGSVTVYAKWIISAEKKADIVATFTAKYAEADYDEADWAKMSAIITEAVEAVNASETVDEIAEIIESTDSKLAVYRTKADKELAEAKNAASTELDEFLNEENYTVESWTEIQTIIATAKGDLGGATTVEQVNQILTRAKADLNAIETKPNEPDSSSSTTESDSSSSTTEPDSSSSTAKSDSSSGGDDSSSGLLTGCFGSIGGMSMWGAVISSVALLLKKKKED